MKIVNDLARQGLIETTRGRGGGLRLSKEPEAIRVGDVVRASETDFRLVECFDARTNLCTLTPSCRLKHVFEAALEAYFKVLDGATLADMGTGTPPSTRRGAAGAAAREPVAALAMPGPGRRPRAA
jgi:Rrf2 family transcriptional regulator, nitric oxide-sensitive transcriptional repressor